MTSFDARLRMMGTSGLPLGVEIDLTAERMTVKAGESEVADWALEEIKVSSLPDGFHIVAEGEEVVVNVTDNKRFASEIGL